VKKGKVLVKPSSLETTATRFLTDYGMFLVLVVLFICFGLVTVTQMPYTGASAGRNLAQRILAEHGEDAQVLIVVQPSDVDKAMAQELRERLADAGATVLDTVTEGPPTAAAALERIGSDGQRLDVIACTPLTANWNVFDRSLKTLAAEHASLKDAVVMKPGTYWGPQFLTVKNLLNVADQTAVYAILAIGMTMVIITGGIDLSVGSLIALSGVVAALLIRDAASGVETSNLGLVACSLGAILICAAVGLFSGTMVTVFRVAPFIATLAMMQMARGFAFVLNDGETIGRDVVPEAYTWLGRERIFWIPNTVLLMVVLYVIAHIVMTRTSLGRYIYAVGGNPEAARLSGVPVKRVLLLVYTLCGALAGLGGIIVASKLQAGDPRTGDMRELYVIAAVVVGGTSLSGGEGKILSTLIGALIIASIENGMNMVGLETYPQMIMLGAVILGAVLLDNAKKRGWLGAQFATDTGVRL